MYTSFKTHTHFSLLKSSAKAERLAERCAELGYGSCAITDFSNLSGSIDFYKEMKDKGIKSIFGQRVLIGEIGSTFYLTIIARNLNGWKTLIRLTSLSNECHNVGKDGPSILKEDLESLVTKGDLLAIATQCPALEAPDRFIQWLRGVFGPEHVFIERDRTSIHQNQFNGIDGVRIASHPIHYAYQEDSIEHRILLSSDAKSTIEKINKERKRGKSTWMDKFFEDDIYFLHSEESLRSLGYSQEEIDNTQILSSMCENYAITNRPSLPKFDCPDGKTEAEYLRFLCQEGWKKIYQKDWDRSIYGDRVKKELSVISEAQLEGYFLIVNDFVHFGKNNGWLMGPGRGCFLPDTMVKMSDLGYKPISMIKNGDVVIDAYGKNQEVYNTFTYEIDEEILELEFENEKVIRCTKDHKFLTDRGWVEAQFLTENDNIIEI